MSESVIRVALATDENYLDYAKITIASLLSHHSQETVEVYLLHSGLIRNPEEVFASLHSLGNFILKPVRIEDAFFKDWPEMRWSRATYFRMILPELFPDFEKIIYLDCDLLVLDDIEELWNLSLKGCACAAAGCRVSPDHYQKLGLNPVSGYFNAGVMVFNPAQMKQEKSTGIFIELFQKYSDIIKYPDQDILNLAYEGKWRKMPLRWNLITSVYRNPPTEGLYTEAETVEALRNPGIAHFTGTHKPWLVFKTLHHPYAGSYRKYAKIAGASPELLRRLFWKSIIHRSLVAPKKSVPWDESILKKDA